MSPQPVWARAIARLLTAKHYRSQAAFIAAARKRHIIIRPNTLSDALSATGDSAPRLDTLITIAAALEVPLWALCCEEDEYRAFTAALDTQDHRDAERRQIVEAVLAQLVPRTTPAAGKTKRRA